MREVFSYLGAYKAIIPVSRIEVHLESHTFLPLQKRLEWDKILEAISEYHNEGGKKYHLFT